MGPLSLGEHWCVSIFAIAVAKKGVWSLLRKHAGIDAALCCRARQAWAHMPGHEVPSRSPCLQR